MTDKEMIKADIIKELLTQKSLTRGELVKKYNMRPATLLEIVDRIKEAGILSEPERKGVKTGRKASPLRLNSDFGRFAGIELQPGLAKGVVIDTAGNVLDRKVTHSAPGVKNRETSLKEIEEIILYFRSRGSLWENVKALGFADPGLADTQKGMALNAVNIDGWRNMDIKKILGDISGVQLREVYPAASAAARAEYMSRLPECSGSLFYLEMADGVGGGFIKDGRTFTGDNCCAMEAGHIVVIPGGPLCQCGNRGCLEALAGSSGIKRKVGELVSGGVTTRLRERDFSVRYFVECALAGDKAAATLARELAENIGRGLSAVVAILNPSVIVLSGTLAGLGNFLTDNIRGTLAQHCFPMALEKLKIEISKLGGDSAVLGAAYLARERAILAAAKDI
jgi:glucokinase